MYGIEIGQAARRWAWLIILLGAIAAITAAAVSYELPRVYEAQTVALVNPKQLAPQTSTDPGLGTGVTTDTLLATYVRLVNATPTARKLIADGIPRSEDQLKGSITAVAEKNTTLIDIVVHDQDPQVALAIAQDVVPAFNTSLRELQASNAAPGSTTPRLDALVPWEVPSKAPTTPVSPRTRTNIAVALAAGLILGAALAAWLEFLDKSLKSEADVRIKLGLPLLGAVLFKKRSRGFSNDREGVALVTVTHPKDPISEAYKAIRTNLMFNSLDRKLRTIVVSSTMPGEGKTITACNLAVTLAQAGNRVILVDADFRRPELHRVFHRSRNEGLGNFILGEVDESEMLLTTVVPNLRILCSGLTPPNPSELLGSARMAATIEKLKTAADIIVFDTPPVGAVTDATVLAARTDGMILVVERGRTPVDGILQAKARLDAVGANILGVVLNKVRSGDAGSYYYYKYYAEPEPRSRKGEAATRREQKQSAALLETMAPRSSSSAPGPSVKASNGAAHGSLEKLPLPSPVPGDDPAAGGGSS